MHPAIFVALPILVGLLAIWVYMRRFYRLWKEIRLMLPIEGCTLQEAKRLFGTIEEQVAKDPILERKLGEFLSCT
jgi:hypothetical protein